MKMKLNRITSILFILSAFSCVKHDFENSDRSSRTCGVDDPLAELPWLKEKVRQLEASQDSRIYPYFYLVQGELNGQTVFVIENCCPFCGTIRVAFNCQGEELGPLHDTGTLKNKRIVWKPAAFQCAV